ncbi:MAG: hypothetical protein WAL25_02805 [Acidimicrobiia bacterium]
MSRQDDYTDEMFTKRLSDVEVEAVLSGGQTDDPILSEVARALAALDPARFDTSSDSSVAEIAARAAAVARSGEPAKLAATARHRRGLSLTPRLATAAVAAILIIGLGGVAAASNTAVPGDPLYGVDRALETIGIGDGATEERLSEASTLTARGQTTEALDLLAETLGSNSEQASDALLRAAARLHESGPGSENSNEVRSNLADMLEWMATTDFTGQDFGRGVAERAREIGGENQGQGRGNQGENQGQGQGNQGQGQGNQGQNQGQGQGNQGQSQGNSGKPDQ